MVISAWILVAFILGYSPLGQNIVGVYPSQEACTSNLDKVLKGLEERSLMCIEVKIGEGSTFEQRGKLISK